MSKAEEYIAQFRTGERYQPPPSAFLSSGRIVSEDLEPFAPALSHESGPVREQIVRLLADLGKRADPLYEMGGQLIRNRRIIEMLIDGGLRKDDLGREAALTALQTLVPPEMLKGYGKQITHDFTDRPSTTSFLVVAKAKPADCIPVIRRLIQTPRWSQQLEPRVAAAALGDAGIDREYCDEFRAASDGAAKANLAKILGWIGTEHALRTLAEGLRTNAVTEVPMSFRRSVRVDVLEALSYNFPDQPVLYETQINDDSGYAKAEKFCEDRLGATWSSPRPPYLKIMGYPIPARE